MEPSEQMSEVYREEILQRNPLFRYYLQGEFSHDLSQWDPEAINSIIGLYKSVEDVRGAQWDTEIMGELVERWKNLGTEDPRHDEKITRIFMGTHLMAGYEVGKIEDLQFFTPDLRKRYKELGLISAQFLPVGRTQEAEEFLFGVMVYGTRLKAEIAEESQAKYDPKASSDDTWGAWKDFIEKELDMEGI